MSEFNRWELTNEVREKDKPIIKDFHDKMKTLSVSKIESMDNEEFRLQRSDAELSHILY